MDRIRAILFDWDGTLFDSYRSGFEASMRVFAHFGIPADRDRFLDTYAPNWYETYRRLGLPEDRWAEADRIWLEAFAERPAAPFPFVPRLLEALGRRRYALGIVTSGDRRRVTGEIERHGLGPWLAVCVCREDTPEKKPDPAPLRRALGRLGVSPAEAVYVGDRPEDVVMGRRVGTLTVAVESAYARPAHLAAVAPDALLPDAGHLPGWLARRRG